MRADSTVMLDSCTFHFSSLAPAILNLHLTLFLAPPAPASPPSSAPSPFPFPSLIKNENVESEDDQIPS